MRTERLRHLAMQLSFWTTWSNRVFDKHTFVYVVEPLPQSESHVAFATDCIPYGSSDLQLHCQAACESWQNREPRTEETESHVIAYYYCNFIGHRLMSATFAAERAPRGEISIFVRSAFDLTAFGASRPASCSWSRSSTLVNDLPTVSSSSSFATLVLVEAGSLGKCRERVSHMLVASLYAIRSFINLSDPAWGSTERVTWPSRRRNE